MPIVVNDTVVNNHSFTTVDCLLHVLACLNEVQEELLHYPWRWHRRRH